LTLLIVLVEIHSCLRVTAGGKKEAQRFIYFERSVRQYVNIVVCSGTFSGGFRHPENVF